MLNIYSINSGSKGNCTVVEADNSFIIIDCGGKINQLKQGFKDINLDYRKASALLITHKHTDHIAQLKLFKDIPIFSPIILDYPSIKLEANKYYKIEDFIIKPILLSHDCVPTIGFIIEYFDEKLVYITDTGYVKDSYLDDLYGCNYLILEFNHDLEMLMKSNRPQFLKSRIASDSGHLCNEDAALLTNKIISVQTKLIWLAHISLETNDEELALKSLYNNCDHDLLNNIDIKTLKQNEITVYKAF